MGDKRVGDVMRSDVTHVSPTTTVGETLDLMFENKISALPVVDGDRCVGIVTATDLVVLIRSTYKVLQSEYPHYDDCLWAIDLVQKQIGSDPVRNIMSEVLVETSSVATVREAADLMVREGVHHLPVVDDDKLAGFLSSHDLARAIASAET